jgi:uncharacterized membrane protein YeaQ/YmgE (transglycosylase-associated protein family)
MNKEDQIWQGIFLTIPTVFAFNLANVIASDDQTSILYAMLFGGIGAMVGYGLFYFLKNKSKQIKILSLVGSIIAGFLSVFLLSAKPSDEEILKRKWITQTIGEVQFDNPQELILTSSEIPESVKWYYKSLKTYSDSNTDRITIFLDSKIATDTILIIDSYSNYLEGMLQKQGVNRETVKMEPLTSDKEEISAKFTFELNGKEVKGYGYMFKKGEILESIWLMPIKEGFSNEYIEEFEAGIFPNYK